MISRFAQVHQNMMSGHLNYTNDAFMAKVNAGVAQFSTTVDPMTAAQIAQGKIYGELVQQSHLWGYIDTFRWFAFATFLLIPLLLLIKKPKQNQE